MKHSKAATPFNRRGAWPADSRAAAEMLHAWSDEMLQRHAARTAQLIENHGLARENAAWQAFREINATRGS